MVTTALLYDAVGTLVHTNWKLQDIHALVAATFANTPPLETVIQAFPDPTYFFYVHAGKNTDLAWQVQNDAAFRAVAVDYYTAAFRRAGLSADEHDLRTLLHSVYDEVWDPQAWQMFPEVVSVLEAGQRRGYVQGVVSDAPSLLLGVLDRLGLNRYLDFVIVSALTGLAKPDAAIFDLALQRAGVQPGEAIHVGDNYVPDVVGARAAGIPVLLLDRSGIGPPVDVPVIHNLEEIWRYVVTEGRGV